MLTLTYGTLPRRGQFNRAWDWTVPGSDFAIHAMGEDARGLERLGWGWELYLSSSELWDLCCQLLAESQSDEQDRAEWGADFLSSILFRLGIEWV